MSKALNWTLASERRWLGVTVALMVALIMLPEMWAFLWPPVGRVYLLSFYTPQDVAAYLAAMREAASSPSWLVTNRLTPEPHSPTLLYPLYILVAKIAGRIGVPLEAGFLLFLSASRLAFLLLLCRFVAAFIDHGPWRRWAFFTILGSGGFASLWLILGAVLQMPSLVEDMAVEWRYLELNTFLALFSYPHLLLALGAELAIAACWYHYLQSGQGRHLTLMVGCLLLLGLANPFSLVTVGAVVGVRTSYQLVARRYSSRDVVVAIAFVLVSVPFFLFHFLTFARDPFWSTVYGEQNAPHLSTPPLLALLSSFGLVLPLALIGGWSLAKAGSQRGVFLLQWAIPLALLVLLPLPYQRRFGLGLHPLLALLAFLGIILVRESGRWQVLSSTTKAVYRGLLFLGLVSSSLGAGVMVVMGSMGGGPLGGQSFASGQVVKAAQWLSTHTDEADVVLSAKETANVVIRYFPGRVVLAHDIATLDPVEKAREVKAFFQPGTADAWRLRLIEEYGVTIVIQGPGELALGDFQPDGVSYLGEIYRNEEVRVFAVLSSGWLGGQQ